jgi:hypothetical protein
METNRIERLPRRQLADALVVWLSASFATPYPVTLRWVRALGNERMGETERKGRRFIIRLSERACSRRTDVLDIVLHEFAHCIAWRHDRVEAREHRDHPDEYWLVLGRVWRAWWGEP